MHTRRISTFLLGAWLGCSIFMAFVVLQNLHSSELVMNAPLAPVTSMTKTLGQDQMKLLLHHQGVEQNRNLLYLWGRAQLFLGLVLAAFLYFATQKRILSVALCGIMIALVIFQISIMPELSYRGRETDFPTGNQSSDTMVRTLLLYQLMVVSEGVKFVVGGILASYLFAFRTSRKRSGPREIELVDQSGIDLDLSKRRGP